MNPKIFFITGTDTEVGKTFCSCYLLNKYNQLGYKTLALKPIESGGLNDTKLLKFNASVKTNLSDINFYNFQEPIAPHIAASNNNLTIQAKTLASKTVNIINKYLTKNNINYILIEGAGGIAVPINYNETYIDFIKYFNQYSEYKINIILITKIKLGCINHTLLSYSFIKNNNLNLHGWIANFADLNNSYTKQTIRTISNFINQPPIYNLEFLQS